MPLGQRAKLALLIGAVAVVVVIGLAIGYAVLGADNQPQGNQPPSQPSGAGGSGTSGNGSQSTDKTATALLTDDAMLNPDQAKVLDRIEGDCNVSPVHVHAQGEATRSVPRAHQGQIMVGQHHGLPGHTSRMTPTGLWSSGLEPAARLNNMSDFANVPCT